MVCTRSPTAKPNFTIGTLRKAIPKHCFERSLVTSSLYLLADLTAAAALFYATTYFDNPSVPRWVAYSLLWPLYWFFQGAVCTGIWVIAHECGHQAFSDYQSVNDTVGLILHSCLLVPYYSWKHSHRRHHSNTGSIDKDEVFVPTRREHEAEQFEWRQFAPVRLLYIVNKLTMGWPLYLFTNVTGRPYPRWANHFDPYSPIFSKRERTEVLISDAALAIALYALTALGRHFGWLWLLRVYVIPYVIVNHWLVMITWLQHTHPALPHFNEQEWDWLRGALSTVDRSYGFLDVFHHHIADTHVCHHLFSQMPHYHAQEATEALKPILGEYYQCDKRNVWRAMWTDLMQTRYVSPDKPGDGTYWYRSYQKKNEGAQKEE